MRYETLRIRGIGPYRDEVSVDLADLPGILTAVVGPNGAGKSMFLGSLLGGIYRDVPGRGSLMDLATERGAFVEVRATNGQPWTFRQTVDPVSKKSEVLILDAQGRPVLDDGKVRTADAWVRAHMPPIEVLLSSVFAAQGSEGFLAMRPAERKAVLLRLLGVERLEELAAGAREKAKEARQALAVLEARIGDERRRGGDVDALRAQHAAAVERVERATAELAAARDALQKAREAAAAHERRRELVRRLQPLQERERELRAVLERADEIRAAVEERDGLQREIERVQFAEREESAGAERIRATLARERAEWERAKEAAHAAEQRAERARARLADRERIEAEAAALPKLRDEVAAAEDALAKARRELERLQSQRVAGAEERITALRSGLASIAEAGTLGQAQSFAAHALDVDTAAVQMASELPEFIAAARRDVTQAEGRVRAVQDTAQRAERVAARAPELERAAEDLEAAERERDDARARMNEVKARGVKLLDEAKAHEQARDDHREHAKALHLRLQSTDELVAQADRLTAAEAQLSEVTTQSAAIRSELEELPATDPGIAASVAGCERQVEADDRALRAAEREAATAEHAVTQAEAAAARIAELEAERSSVERDLADWNVLARDLGRDGVQASLIDAAGPELTELVNDLLHTCVGPRWSVAIETTRLSADGKRQLEGLDVRVIDTERGRDALVETYSGGERVLLGEAVSLALTMLACRRSGLEGVTLVRDESGAALDPERSHAYVAMLRRAAELVGASRVLLVSHSPDVAELCDSRLVISDGRVEVQS